MVKKIDLLKTAQAEGLEIQAEGWWGVKIADVEYLTHPVAIALDITINTVERTAKKINQLLLHSKPVVFAAQAVIARALKGIMALAKVTENTLRIYTLEGPHLSRKDGGRMTWYTNVETALDVFTQGELKTTGRIVYVDLNVNIMSDYNYRHYKQGSAAITLKDDLIKIAKRNWKYASDAVISQSITSLAELQAAAVKEVM